MGATCSSVVERPLMARWVVGSIPHGGHIEIFLVPAIAPRFVEGCDICYPVCGVPVPVTGVRYNSLL